MTMMSFRLDDEAAADAQHWADKLGLDRSELVRQALHALLVRLRAEEEVAAWEALPPTRGELALADAADWGPAEEWSDWNDATR